MCDQYLLDLYTDYLITSTSYTTATGLADVLEQQYSHDRITRFLRKETYTPKRYWQLIKPTVRRIEHDDGVLDVDDTIEEKPYTDENDIICWHCNHQAKVGDFTGMVGVVKFEEDTDLCVHPNNSPHNERYRTFKAGRLYEATIILAGGEDAEKDEYHIIFNNNTFARFVYAGFFHFYSEKW